MQDLRVIGVEDGALVVASDEGERYRIAVDEALVSKLKQAVPVSEADRKIAPKEIQALIRSGMSAQDITASTGVSVDHIRRFEGPVLAEREFIVRSALSVVVHTAMDTDALGQGTTFGTVIGERLNGVEAVGTRWTSWKEPTGGGWVVALAFTAEQIDHDARWRYDPKKSLLAPLNSEAITLSQQGDVGTTLIPRLRAVDSQERPVETSRFDSGAFSESDLVGADTAAHHDYVPYGVPMGSVPMGSEDGPLSASTNRVSAINRAADEGRPSSQTADLLEALRRRRGEREAALAEDDDPISAHPSSGGMHLVDIPLDEFDEESGIFPTTPGPASPHSRAAKKGRVTMPSWDEIVFGARPGDDPA